MKFQFFNKIKIKINFFDPYKKFINSVSRFQCPPTLSLGINLSSLPCLRKTFPAVCDGLIPIPSSVIIADVAAGTLNSSAANFKTAVNGVDSGTESLQGNFICYK